MHGNVAESMHYSAQSPGYHLGIWCINFKEARLRITKDFAGVRHNWTIWCREGIYIVKQVDLRGWFDWHMPAKLRNLGLRNAKAALFRLGAKGGNAFGRNNSFKKCI